MKVVPVFPTDLDSVCDNRRLHQLFKNVLWNYSIYKFLLCKGPKFFVANNRAALHRGRAHYLQVHLLEAEI